MADVRDIGTPTQFPDNPTHGDEALLDNGLVYRYVDQDEDGQPFKEGHWDLVGTQGPTGPSGRPGPAGTEGHYRLCFSGGSNFGRAIGGEN